MKKKSLFGGFVFIIVLLMLVFIKRDASAANVFETKTDGTITWTMYDDGTLEIGGSGEIKNNLGYLNYRSTAIKRVIISGSVTSIGKSAFNGCSKLTSITIPDSVTSIGYYAFYGCSKLTSITIPDSVTSIGYYAFYGCSSLTSITIPDSVTSIGYYAFYGCSSLTSITIPDSVTSIEYDAFYDCSSLTSITIPNSVTSIGVFAFFNCSSLTSITIPNSVTSIGDYAFYDCSSLTSITIPNSVTSIGEYAFKYCSSLTEVILPNSFSDDSYLKTRFQGTPWFVNRMGTIKGSIGDIFYELDGAGNLSLSGNGELFIASDNSIEDYVAIVKNIIISETSKIECGYLENYFKNLEKIVNNSSSAIKLRYDDGISWCDINDTTEPIFSISNGTAIKVNQKLPKHYRIVFDGNGATSGSMDDIIAEADKYIKLSKNQFKKEHFVFDGWQYSLSESSYYSSLSDEDNLYLSVSGAIDNPIVILYAKWREQYKYTVDFDDDGEGYMPSVSVYAGDTYTLPENGFVAPEGKEFDSWKIGKSYYNPGDILTISSHTYVCPVWKDTITEGDSDSEKENNDTDINENSNVPINAGDDKTNPTQDDSESSIVNDNEDNDTTHGVGDSTNDASQSTTDSSTVDDKEITNSETHNNDEENSTNLTQDDTEPSALDTEEENTEDDNNEEVSNSNTSNNNEGD
ncbi:leucine-rich repeat domain-containing protein, partial [Butyrivibrio sp. VCD2006]|uniref:leucine-rich repeat domain-containing protein n=1 Tax=Butyrivibrio sp. VCD2006 TaxID=1280664 RepID=UPI001FA730A0